MMTFSEYMQRAARTLPEQLDPPDLLADAALGLCGEAGEIRRASRETRGDEVGDGWWYVAAAFWALEVQPECVTRQLETDPTPLELLATASRIAERAKKIRYHGETFETHRADLIEALSRYASILSAMTERPDGTIWADNIEKLEARYPEGFSPEGS